MLMAVSINFINHGLLFKIDRSCNYLQRMYWLHQIIAIIVKMSNNQWNDCQALF